MRTQGLSTRRSLFSAAALALTVCCVTALGQNNPQHPYSENGSVRKDDPSAPCKFAAEYARIRENKSDPRVAYIEIARLVDESDPPEPFKQRCKNVALQSEDIEAAVFDKAHGFLHIIYVEETVNTAVAYFSRGKGKPGIILFVKNLAPESHSFVFQHDADQWHDVTQQYLGFLHLTENDYIVVPQYGRTARVMTLTEDHSEFRHKLWLHWNGVKFEEQTARPKDWRCPDSYRYFAPDQRRRFCQ